jgi:hypothetical protein
LAGQRGEARVGEAHALEPRRRIGVDARQAVGVGASALGVRDDLLDLARNQGSIAQRVDLPRRDSRRAGLGDIKMRSGRAATQPARSSAVVPLGRPASVGSRPALPVSSQRSAFCSDSWKLRPIAITSPTDFIWVVRRERRCREFLEGEARDLGDDVVDGRLEARPA